MAWLGVVDRGVGSYANSLQPSNAFLLTAYFHIFCDRPWMDASSAAPQKFVAAQYNDVPFAVVWWLQLLATIVVGMAAPRRFGGALQ